MVIQRIAIVGRNGITRSRGYTVPINVGKVKISKELGSRREILIVGISRVSSISFPSIGVALENTPNNWE